MSAPIGVAAIEGMSVGKERHLLQRTRKFEAGSHISTTRMPFCPHTFYMQAGGGWISAAELTFEFRRGQRRKTRNNKAKKAWAKAQRVAKAKARAKTAAAAAAAAAAQAEVVAAEAPAVEEPPRRSRRKRKRVHYSK